MPNSALKLPISPFEGFGIKNEAKEASREAIHEAIDGWIDEVIEMKKGAGLGGITEEIFKRRQEMMGKIVEQIIVELFSDELNRETMVCPNCGRVLNRRARIEHVLCWHKSSEELKECLRKVKEAGLIPERDILLCVVGDGARWIWRKR